MNLSNLFFPHVAIVRAYHYPIPLCYSFPPAAVCICYDYLKDSSLLLNHRMTRLYLLRFTESLRMIVHIEVLSKHILMHENIPKPSML